MSRVVVVMFCKPLFSVITLPMWAVAKYCDEHVCVCVSVCDDISGITRAIFTKFFVHVAYGCDLPSPSDDLVIFWRSRCQMHPHWCWGVEVHLVSQIIISYAACHHWWRQWFLQCKCWLLWQWLQCVFGMRRLWELSAATHLQQIITCLL